MSNDRIHDYYTHMAQTIKDPKATRNKAPDFSIYDVAFVQQYANPEHDLLDAGAGTGLLLNHISSLFQSVLAVELYPEFSKFVMPRPNLDIVNHDIRSFQTEQRFDLLIAFGLMNFFNTAEAAAIYHNFCKFLKPSGRLIIKNQMGREDTVTVDGMSQELGQHYYSEYRTAEAECALIVDAGLTVETVSEIYPEKFNRWPNTWFRAIVAQK